MSRWPAEGIRWGEALEQNQQTGDFASLAKVSKNIAREGRDRHRGFDVEAFPDIRDDAEQADVVAQLFGRERPVRLSGAQKARKGVGA